MSDTLVVNEYWSPHYDPFLVPLFPLFVLFVLFLLFLLFFLLLLSRGECCTVGECMWRPKMSDDPAAWIKNEQLSLLLLRSIQCSVTNNLQFVLSGMMKHDEASQQTKQTNKPTKKRRVLFPMPIQHIHTTHSGVYHHCSLLFNVKGKERGRGTLFGPSSLSFLVSLFSSLCSRLSLSVLVLFSSFFGFLSSPASLSSNFFYYGVCPNPHSCIL